VGRPRGRLLLALPIAAVLFPCLGAGAAEPGAPPPVSLGPDLQVRELQPGFWVHVSQDARGIAANGMIARTPGGLLLVDAAWTDDQAERLVAWAEKTLHASFAKAIVTHSHADRAGGIGALSRHKVPVLALDLTATRIRDAGGSFVPSALLTAIPGTHAEGLGYEAFFPGAGHAPDNIVVWFPAGRILFGGCFVKAENAEDLGNVADADLASWPKAAAAVRDRYPDAATVVPGHGPVGGRVALDRTLDLLGRRPATP
jgi:glyoxylase-like metal-dependent hydrolase (beta-lactamase superfamily II)